MKFCSGKDKRWTGKETKRVREGEFHGASAVQNFYVTSISQAEPYAQLFHPPAGYRMVNMDALQGQVR
jgi:hypothetical protein